MPFAAKQINFTLTDYISGNSAIILKKRVSKFKLKHLVSKEKSNLNV